MKKNYFEGCRNLEELRSEYKKLLKQLHPDNGGSAEECARLNAEYKEAFSRIEKNSFFTDFEDEKEAARKYDAATDEAIRATLQKIIILEGLEIEICGCWIWVKGNTYQHRETLKAAGFNWSKSKKSWYWKPYETEGKKRGSLSEEQRRIKYGYQKIDSETVARIA